MNRLPMSHDQIIRVSISVIAVVAVFTVLKVGGEIFAPLLLALVTGVMVAPVMDFLQRLRLPPALAALLVLLTGIIMIAALAVVAEPLIWRIAEELPRIKLEIRAWVEEFRSIIRGIDEVNKQVEEALGADPTVSEEEVTPAMPNLTNALFLAPQIMGQILIFIGTLYFFLLTRTGIYVWMSERIGGDRRADDVQQRFMNAEQLVSRYFLTVAAINTSLGVALSIALSVIGLPGAIVWGVFAALLNFVLYLGPALLVVGLAGAGVLAFDGIYSFVPALTFLCLNMIEAQFATPALLGKNIALNPLLIFVSLVLWLWLWGPVGGIIAIPVLLITVALLNILDSTEQAPAE